jgi:WD40 repeat protein
MPKFTFIHLSDLHFRENDPSQNRVLSAFFKDVEKLKNELNIKPDFIIFSGDLVNIGDNYKEFKSVKENFIDLLLNTLSLNLNKFFICPGNHDIKKSVISPDIIEVGLDNYIVSTENIDNIIDKYDTDFKSHIKQRFNNYKRFLDEFNITDKLSPKSNVFFSFQIRVKNTNIGIACLNSSLRSTGIGGRHDYGKLILGEKQINLALKKLEDCDIKIANLHHSFDWIDEIERHDIKRIIKREFNFILYGHNHSSSLDQIINSESDTISINAPALYENSRTFVGYSIVQVFATETRIHLRTYFKDRDIFDRAIDKIPNGIFIIKSPQTPQKFDTESIEDNFVPIKYPLEQIKSIIKNYESLDESELFCELDKLRSKSFKEIGYNASSIVSLLIKKNKSSLRAKVLNDLCLKGTDFTGADLTETKFIKTDISDTFFLDVTLDNALFDEVNLSDSQFIEIENKRAVDFTDENEIVSAGSSGAIIFWNSKIILRGHRSSVLDLRFSCCKQYLASTHDNGMIFIWQPNQSTEPLKVLRKYRSPVYSVCWSPKESHKLVSNGNNGSLMVWDWKNSETQAKEIEIHKKEILTIDWNTNGKSLLTSGIDRRIFIYDTSDWTPVCKLPIIHKDYVRAVKWRDETYFASCSDDGKVAIWSWSNNACVKIYEYIFDVPVLSLAWHPNLYILACGLRDDTVVFWDLENLSNVQSNDIRRIKLHVGRVWDINWDKKGKFLISAGNEGKIILWNKFKDETTNKLLSENDISKNTQTLKMNFSCNGLKLKNLTGICKSGYQTFTNKDREWDVQECSLQDWLINHGAELD